ncbi:hypothetical protein [Aureitalea marina]|uniref:hypothetical protein n=1 Tax=Aureitalea marina TaxID=930804 RepID=UPI001FE81530|nr:hypothetical protein [Aureitalea marina]
MRLLILILILYTPQLCIGQLQASAAAEEDSIVLGFREYLGYVKKYHPIAKQATSPSMPPRLI